MLRRLMASRARRSVAVRIVRALLAAFFVLSAAGTTEADRSETVLHEPIPADEREDLALSAVARGSGMPALLNTPSGVVAAPDPSREASGDRVYATGGTSADDTFVPDRDTRRPDVESYDDPFSPTTSPYKRLRAFDAVNLDYSLRVRAPSMHPVPMGGAVMSSEDPFFGDLTVELSPGRPTRIPSVGPGARLVRVSSIPQVEVAIGRDGSDNWFAKSATRTRARLLLEIAIPRATFGGAFADVSWSALERHVTPQPEPHRAAFGEVERAIGISRAMAPREVVVKLVEYFRGFEPSEAPPRERGDIYLDLALSKRGVCRHRAFAFLVTALNAGIPARLVANEAHAWVEVFDTQLWHRIDLGGAAANLSESAHPDRPMHVAPADLYAWPAAHDSGQVLAQRAREVAASDVATKDSAAPAAAPPPADDGKPSSEIAVEVDVPEALRGSAVRVRGTATSAAGPCTQLRVDLWVTSPANPSARAVGSLATDANGRFEGSVVVPHDLPPGDYAISASTEGGSRCGASNGR